MKNNKYKSEFHVHTIYSKDSTLSYLFLLFMLKIKNIDTVAITDHNEIEGAIQYKKLLEKHKINVIVGEEIFSLDGEIIGLGLNEKIEPNLSAKKTIELIKKQNGIVYIPHPYDEKRIKTVLKEKTILENKDLIDLIEVHNGRNIDSIFSVKQEEIADKYNIKKIVGSDSHVFFEIGRNYVVSNEKIDDVNLLKSIDYEFVKSSCILFSHQYTKFARIIKMILKGDFYGIFRIINRRCKRKK